MERLRSLTRRAGVVAPALLAAHLAAGCSSAPPVDLVSDAFKQAVSLDKPEPASQVICFWQRRLSSLPDPTRDGAQTSGIAGQMFLFTPSNSAAEVNGDLSVVVYDETPRPPGQPGMQPELWHYNRDTLKRLVTTDERFGKSFVLFLPWPAHWQGSVTAVKILARYQSPGSPDLFAGEVRLNLDFSAGGPVWSDVSPGAAQGPTRGQSVPDPARVLEQARTAATTHPFPASTPAPPAGAVVPPVTGAPANGSPPAGNTLPPPVLPPIGGGVTPQPLVIPRGVP